MSKLSRRDALAHGGRAVAAAAVLSTLPSIAHAEDDAGLCALYDEYRRLEKQYMAAEGKATHASVAVRKAFRAEPTLKTHWKAINTPGSPERVALIQAPGRLAEAIDNVESAAKERWGADLAEAEKQAGVPALKKKQDAACNAWSTALDLFIATRAHTAPGMILKFRIAWCERQEREWQATHSHRDVEFWDDAMASVLIDLERLAGMAA